MKTERNVGTNGAQADERELPAYNYALHKLSQLQDDLVASARMWAMDEVGAAVSHQLNEPLTALLIYLNEIEHADVRSSDAEALPAQARGIVRKALIEAKRACEILERIRRDVTAPSVSAQSAVARGRDAISALARETIEAGSPIPRRFSLPPAIDAYPLTPREREVLAQVTAGASNKEGSHRMGISQRTFEAHRAHLMRKFGARNAADLVRTALRDMR